MEVKDINDVIKDISNAGPVERTKTILEIKVIEKLSPEKDGVELNEGYRYNVDGSLPQLADGLAKLAIEFDNDIKLGVNVGQAFLVLTAQYYEKMKGGE